MFGTFLLEDIKKDRSKNQFRSVYKFKMYNCIPVFFLNKLSRHPVPKRRDISGSQFIVLINILMRF